MNILKTKVDFSNKNVTDYVNEILTPLNKFYSSNYKEILNARNENNTKIFEQVYDLYLQKLDTFCKIIEENANNKS